MYGAELNRARRITDRQHCECVNRTLELELHTLHYYVYYHHAPAVVDTNSALACTYHGSGTVLGT